MPDTKSGRERKGLDKQAQLDVHLYERELRSFEEDDEPSPFDGVDDATGIEGVADRATVD